MDKEADTHERLIWPMSYSESLGAGILTVFHPEEYTFLGFKKITKAKMTPTQDYLFQVSPRKKKEQHL